jgi:methylmalonyl-CoA mutase
MLTSRQAGVEMSQVLEPALQLGETADEADWRALVDKGLKGGAWDRLVGKTSDGIALEPLYREANFATAGDVSGMPGAAPFVRGARTGAWDIRQVFAHPSPVETNRAILADLQGGVSGVELLIDTNGERGLAIEDARGLDTALADVILEAAPVSLDAGEHGAWFAGLLRDKLKGVAASGTAFNLDPLGAFMRSGALCNEEHEQAIAFAAKHASELPAARFMRVDARVVHEAGATEAQETATALACGIHYLRALTGKGLNIAQAAHALSFAVSVGPDVLVETAKLRALRLCWARVLEGSGAAPTARAVHIHAFTSQRMMTRLDAATNILRVTTAAFAAAIGGADAITTHPFTDALGLPTPFARRVARNTQLVLMQESHLEQVADPAGGAWFVEKLTRELAELAWTKMQAIEGAGGVVASLTSGALQKDIAAARTARQAAFARRKQTITGVTDFPQLGQKPPEVVVREYSARQIAAPKGDMHGEPFLAMRWAEPFEALRAKAEGKTKGVFFANMGALADFTPRAMFSQNLLAVGGVAAIGAEAVHASMETLVAAFKASGANVAAITGADDCYAGHAENAARALKEAGAAWVLLAGKPGEREAAWRAAGVDQFVFVGVDLLKELSTVHAALGVA